MMGKSMQIEQQQKDVRIIGFDSAWADKSPGAICALHFDKSGLFSFELPRLVNFEQAMRFILEAETDRACTLVAIDQPTIVSNETGKRPVEHIIGKLMLYIGGGVLPANISQEALFGPGAPIWKFKAALDANEDAEKARVALDGLHLIEVFPALALAGLNDEFAASGGAPKYNPKNRKKFKLRDWERVTETLSENANALGLDGLAEWSFGYARCASPSKKDQDCLDAAICALIGAIWRMCDRSDSVVIGDLKNGYMVSPLSDAIRHWLE